MKKSFLITGCTKGIGLAISHQLKHSGYNVIGIARNTPKYDFPGSLYLADLSNAEETETIFNKINMTHPIDGVMCIGIINTLFPNSRKYREKKIARTTSQSIAPVRVLSPSNPFS